MGDLRFGAVIYAKDVMRVARFYKAVMGFRNSVEEAGYAKLEADGIELVIVQVPPALLQSFTLFDPPRRRENTAIKPVFFVETLSNLHDRAIEHGGLLDPTSKIWQFDGFDVCDGHDCEGNVFQLRAPLGSQGSAGNGSGVDGAAQE